MCGILGFNFNDKRLLENALKVTKHRGPDATGKFSDRFVSLGHNRLSIIDLSESGKQPMSNENEDVWITFNGEIYNFKEIKSSLKKKHEFKSNTDTELLIHLYEEEGYAMVNRLQGMFAFCIYDMKKKKLFLARDRVGKKPLYYYLKDGKLIFCSEIKGILEDEEIKREVNLNALPYFLAFRANTSNETMFRDIMKLPAGNIMEFDLKSKETKISEYWDISHKTEEKSEEEYKKEVRELLEDSVKGRLMADVPYGAYLSGGVDSGSIVALMSKYSGQPIKTFSVGFEEESDKESDKAKVLAEKLGCDHHELIINSGSIKHLPDIVYHADEPMSDATAIPLYLLSQYASSYCKVILTGEGSDEIFAGYPQYKFMKMHALFASRMPSFMRKTIPWIAKKTPSFILDKGFRFASALGEKGIERFGNFLNSDNYAKQYLNQVAVFNEEEQSELLGKKVALYEKYNKYFFGADRENIVSKCEDVDFKEPMVEDLLMKVDKNTMAFSIEGRVPFLDYRLVELAAKIPDNLKLRGLSKDKYILRKAVSDLIPKETSERKKRHFFVPIDNWFNGELSSLKDELLSEEYLRRQNIFNSSYIQKINSGFSKSKLFYSRQLWSLMIFQIWHKTFIEGEKVKL
jgi:asparagine synthase (glutamine-hydrolysing)